MCFPTLSVLLGNYTEGPNIKRSLQKILSQSLRPDEIIIIDDCSTDNSIEIIQEIIKDEPEIRLIQNEKNIGTCASLNRIVHEASCEYFHLVGTDDFVLPGFYEKSMNLLSQYPQAGLCSAIVQCQDIKGENLRFDPGEEANAGERAKLEDLAAEAGACEIVRADVRAGPTIDVAQQR